MTFKDAGKYQMPFGKHRGKPLDVCPLKYLDWLVGYMEDSSQTQSPTYRAVTTYLSDPVIKREMEA